LVLACPKENNIFIWDCWESTMQSYL